MVRGRSLEYALANGKKFGIWGGMGERTAACAAPWPAGT